MRATAQATVRPWAPQPLEQARATLQAVNLAALWPQAPTTDLHGTLTAGPDASTGTSTQAPAQQGAWNLTADLTNRAPGPWDAQRLPLAGLQAAGPLRSGRLDGEPGHGHRGPQPPRGQPGPCKAALRPPPGQCKARSACATCRPPPCTLRWRRRPLSGSVQAQMPSQASPLTSTVVRLTADIRSAAPTGTAPASATDLRIDAFTAQGQWNPRTTAARCTSNGWPWMRCAPGCRRRICASAGGAAQATPAAGNASRRSQAIAGQGLVQLTLPGSQVRVQGNIAPHWPGRRPLEPDRCRTNPALAGPLALAGQRPARHAAHRLGQRPGTAATAMEGRLGHAAAATAHGSARPTPSADAKAPPIQLQTSLTSPQLDMVLPRPAAPQNATNVATLLQLRALKAD